MATAKQSLENACASLQPEIASILSRLGRQTLLSLQKIHNKNSQADNLEKDETLFPRSARFKFTLTGSKQAEATKGFQKLQEEAATLLESFQKDIKTKIIAAARLEAKVTLEALHHDFTSSLRVAVQALLICETNFSPDNTDKAVATLLDRYSTELLRPFQIESDIFRAMYKTTHSLAALPTPYDRPSIADATSERSTGMPTASCLLISSLFRALDGAFLQPWQRYLDVVKRKERSLAIKKLSTDHFDADATDKSAMIIDDEPSTDPPTLKAIVDSQVNAKTKNLQQEITHLKATLKNLNLQSKKAGRGPGGASTKKKNPTAAAARDNDTANGAKNTKKKKATPKSSEKRSRGRSRSKSKRTRTGSRNSPGASARS